MQRKRAPGKINRIDPIARLLADPCNSNLSVGLYGSVKGSATRTHRVTNLGRGVTGSTDNSGYIIWFPDYHNNAVQSTGLVNCISFHGTNVDSAPAPTNWGLAAGSSVTTASSLPDPAYGFVLSDVCQDARTLAACMKATYLGTTSNARGLIYPLTNIPPDLLFRGGAANSPPSIAQIISYARESKRCTGTSEVRWRPSGAHLGFRDEYASPFECNTGGGATLSADARTTEPSGIGFAWYGISSANDIQIDMYKAIEWRAEAGSFLSSVKPAGADSSGIIQRVTNALDKWSPGWQTQMMDSAYTFASGMLREAVLGGAGPVNVHRGIEFR